MRKRRQEPEVSTDGWAIPYGDFLTLMLAVFIALYAVSHVNSAKYEVLAESLARAFHSTTSVVQPVTPPAPMLEIPVPHSPHFPTASPVSLIPVPVPPETLPIPGHEGAAPIPSTGRALYDVELQAISSKIAQALTPWINRGEVSIHQSPLWLQIEIRTDVLFPSGVAALSAPAYNVLNGVAGVLAKFPNPIRIEGYTDSEPIHTAKFPSNWELSAARAASVARLFGSHGVKPERLGVVGWGQYRPVASNATSKGRNENRRIVIVVLSTHMLPELEREIGQTGEGVTAILEPLPVPASVSHATLAKPLIPPSASAARTKTSANAGSASLPRNLYR